MKKTLILAICMALCSIGTQAQLEVKETGQVTINANNSNKLQIGTPVDTAAAVTIGNASPNTSLKIYCLSNAATSTGIHVLTENPSGKNIGIRSIVNSYGNYDKNTPNIALYGESTGAKYSVGVYGKAILAYQDSMRHHCGAGIYGTSAQQIDTLSFRYHGRYAGYFNGKVRVAGGSLYANVLSPSINYSNGGSSQNNSATLLSENRGESVTEKLCQVDAIQFLRDERDLGVATDGILSDETGRMKANDIDVDDTKKASQDGESSLSVIQYGLAADQLKEVYPELVYEDEEGNVSINYIEMVPLLVQSINELSKELAELKGTSAKKAKSQTTTIEDTVEDIDQVRMDQNKPNPFSESTVIKLNIPKDTKTATIFIYDLSGKQVKSIPVSERGKTDITVYARDLIAGMYIYNLVVDGQVKVTRRMIVSEI